MNQFLTRVMLSVLLVASSSYALGEMDVSLFPKQIVDVRMRDGSSLPTNIFLPKECWKEKNKVPCILIRQPLGKDHFDPSLFRFVLEGYALVIQSTRSFCDESGKSMPYLTDGPSQKNNPSDGYDTVEWLARQEFCNGSVSTIGMSALGITQFLLAASSPPSLTCQYIEMAPPSMYHYAVFPGGQLRKEQVEGWLKLHKRDSSVLAYLKTKKEYDTFWKDLDVFHRSGSLKIPQMHVGGWYDIFLQGTIDAFLQAQAHSAPALRSKHRLIIGPWGHKWKMFGTFGPFKLTDKQKTPLFPITEQKWLDFHVRHIDNGVEATPVVQYYVMGPFDTLSAHGNEWRVSDSWPPKGFEHRRLYLGNGLLLSRSSSKGEAREVPFHAKDPTPTIGGRNLFLPDGPFDVQALLSRKDVLLYSTPPLEQDTEVTGRIFAHLYLSHGQKERDVALRLVDIYPTGEHYLIAEGYAHMQPQKNKEPEHVTVDLWSTSMVFAKGHTIGLLISASNFPAYETSFGDEEQGTAFTLHTSTRCPSSILLPMKAENITSGF